ncbi:DUF2071 domain-containing protein [Chitinophaga arvensicola]|uniref:Uncharacterized conserved protein (COG2071) n=1 Tax=Chitinophaga arvensicola TaxID=29529 RepID=A0A1I0S705_9BACT|nr:DUF2071 domain-containing protein [Chitinophaga arvensicola]SEW51177.1 Uncharacterized conserved protein (COG2071) [Chitinophaga arvensicola]
MRLPVIHGYIDRRILVNFAVDPAAVKTLLPAPFRPKLFNGKAIAGICLIRLKHIKPKGLPDFMGINSENGAHRIAVEWEENGVTKEGVYIPRRDTSSRLNAFAGGRFFPGKHHHSLFHVEEKNDHFHVGFTSEDKTSISIEARRTEVFPENSVFGSLENASAFFAAGAVGYSPNPQDSLDGLILKTYEWKVSPLHLLHVTSSFFEDTRIFQKGSVSFDNALLMTNTEHEWHSVPGCPGGFSGHK